MVLRSMNSIFTRHGRWLFGVITLVIIVSFVGFLTPGFTSLFLGTGDGGGRTSGTVGTAFGKKVSVSEFREQSKRGMLFMYMLSGGMFGESQIYDYAAGEAFNSIGQLIVAGNRGIVVSDDEIVDFIENLAMFKGTDGQFSRDKFNRFCKDFLYRNGATEEDLANAIRDGLALRKLYQQVVGCVEVTPGELSEFYSQLYEKFDVATVVFKADAWLGQVKVSPEELAAYFKEHQKEYNIAAQYKTKVVAFSYNEFERRSGAAIPESALKNYYEANKKEFEAKQNGKVALQPFSQVKESIRDRLAQDAAKTTAKNMAQQFATDVYKKIAEDDANRFKYFSELAVKNGRKIIDMAWIAGDSRPEVVLGEPALLTEITKIYIQIPISNPVVGEKAAYVALLEEKKNSRPATLAEVKPQVLKALQAQKALVMAREKARTLAAAINKAADKGVALKKLSSLAEVKNLEPFIMMNPPYGQEGGLIASLADTTPAGSVSQVRDVPNGAMFVLVRKRTLPAAKDFAEALPLVSSRYKSIKQELAQQRFLGWVQSNCQNYQRGNQ